MRKYLFVFVFILSLFTVFVLADDTLPAAEVVADSAGEAVATPSDGFSIWGFLNSNIGVSIVVFILSFILGKIFTSKPKWKALVLKYGPSIMRAIKTAEKKIPDSTENKGLARLDEALKYLIEIEPKLKVVADGDLKTAISAVHSSAEANGNLESK